VQTSSDDGATWTTSREITSTTKKTTWRWYATGPGHGIALASGRLVIPADHTGAGLLRGSHTLLSDDHGQTWRIGTVDDHTDGRIDPDETTVAQLPDGRLYLSAHDEGGTDPTTRAFTYSLTNGSTFSAPFRAAPALIAPVVKGTLLQDTGTSCKPLLFSAPQDPAQRQNLTVRRSADGGRTWRTDRVIAPGPAAYSDLAKLDRTTAGVLYETGTVGPYERIQFRSFTVTCRPDRLGGPTIFGAMIFDALKTAEPPAGSPSELEALA
jgi:sialidase-1